MQKRINIEPVVQTGHNCKPVTIATIEQFFARKLGFMPIPLHKQKIFPYSMRQISKFYGSVQGEMLELQQMSHMLFDLGYQHSVIDFYENFDLFKTTIVAAINANRLVISFFAVDRANSLPTTTYSENEHAAILNAYDLQNDTLHMLHWGNEHVTTFTDFFASSSILHNERTEEYYKSVKDVDKSLKYDLTAEQSERVFLAEPLAKKSITPKPNSGFRCKILILDEPNLQNIMTQRQLWMSRHATFQSVCKSSQFRYLPTHCIFRSKDAFLNATFLSLGLN